MQGKFINDKSVLLGAAESVGLEGAERVLDDPTVMDKEVSSPVILQIHEATATKDLSSILSKEHKFPSCNWLFPGNTKLESSLNEPMCLDRSIRSLKA